MRLSPSQIETIRDTARWNFCADASVWLFGSRVDDTRRGGDVDLYVEATQKNTLLLALRCKIALEDSLDLHIDSVFIAHLLHVKGIPFRVENVHSAVRGHHV